MKPSEDPEHEAAESEETEKKEMETGEEATPEGNEGDVKIPEEFQKKCSMLVSQISSMPMCEFVSSLVSDKRSELYRKEEEKRNKSKKGNKTPKSFSTEDMPSL